jgi:hypothetical protein
LEGLPVTEPYAVAKLGMAPHGAWIKGKVDAYCVHLLFLSEIKPEQS